MPSPNGLLASWQALHRSICRHQHLLLLGMALLSLGARYSWLPGWVCRRFKTRMLVADSPLQQGNPENTVGSVYQISVQLQNMLHSAHNDLVGSTNSMTRSVLRRCAYLLMNSPDAATTQRLRMSKTQLPAVDTCRCGAYSYPLRILYMP